MRAAVLARPAALAAAALVAAGVGLAMAATATGRPVPASAEPRLTAIAERAARLNGDPHPVWATVVLTTHAKALTSATPGDTVPGPDAPVYLITMRGHFVCGLCSHPPGAKTPTGSYMSLVLDAKTLVGMDFGLSPKPPPVAPASLGPVIYLIGHPA